MATEQKTVAVVDGALPTWQVDDLLNTYADAVQQLKDILVERNLQEALKSDDQDLMCVRYALGFKGNVEQATDTFVSAMETRIRFGVSDYKSIENEKEFLDAVPHLRAISEGGALPAKYFQPGPDVHQVTYRFVGRVSPSKLSQAVSMEEWEECSAVRIGLQMRHLNKISRESGKLAQLVTVIDLGGLTQAQLSTSEWFRHESDIAQAMGPEMLRCALVVNCPWFFNVIFKIASNFLSPRTLAKVIVAGSDKAGILSALEKQMGEENVPSHYGGVRETSSWEKMLNPIAGFEEEYIGAGSTFSKEIEIGQQEVLELSWRIQAKDIEFRAHFVSTEIEVSEEIAKAQRQSPIDTTATVHYTADTNGVVTLTWSNRSSYMTGKTIWYQCTKNTAVKQ